MSETDPRFLRVAASMNRVNVREKEPEPIPDPEDLIAGELHGWATMPECGDSFLPWLQERIDTLDAIEDESAKDHAALLLAKGARSEAKYLREKFHQWRGTTAQRGPAKEK